MRISEPTQVTSSQQGGSNWKEEYKQPILTWLNEMKQDPANAGKLEGFQQSCDRIFSVLDSGKPPMKDAGAMNSYIHDHFSALFNDNGNSIYSGQMDPSETFSQLKDLFTKLGCTAEQIADLPQPTEMQNFKYNLDHVWLPQAAGEKDYDFKGDLKTQGYIRQNIADPIFEEIDKGHITTEAGLRQFIQQNPNLQKLIGPQIYDNDPTLKAAVAAGSSDAAYQEVQGLYKALGLDPNSAPKPSSGPTPPPDLQQFEADITSWLRDAGEEGGKGDKGDVGQILKPIFDGITQGTIKTMADVQKCIKDNQLEGKLGPDIYNTDRSFKSLSGPAAHLELQKLYSILGLPSTDVPQPPGPTPPPSGNTLGVMTLNVRTSDASSPGPPPGDDSIAKDPTRQHYWANRQQPLANEILSQSPAIVDLQEATQMQIEGTGKNGDPYDPAHPQVPGLLTLLNKGQQPPDRYKVMYLNESKNDDAIIYDSTKVKPIADPAANKSVPLDSNDGFGQRYAHLVAFQVGNTGKNLIVGDAHAQKMDSGGLTDKDANNIAGALSAMASQFPNADRTPAKSLFMADSNTSNLTQGSKLQNELEGVKNGGNMKSAYDVYPAGVENTSGLWDKGPGPHGKREDVLFTNAELLNMKQGDPTIAAKASDHRPIYGEIKI